MPGRTTRSVRKSTGSRVVDISVSLQIEVARHIERHTLNAGRASFLPRSPWANIRGNQPGPGVEPHTLTGVMGVEHGLHPFESTSPLRGVEVGDQVFGHPQLRQGVAGAGGVGAVVDGLAYIGDLNRANPAAVSTPVATVRSANEKAACPSPRGALRRSLPARACRIAVNHSWRSADCHTSCTSRAPGRSARPILVNAATGSVKNMVPNRLSPTVKSFGAKAWT